MHTALGIYVCTRTKTHEKGILHVASQCQSQTPGMPVDGNDGRAGARPEKGKGSVELRNVSFRYPARPEVPVFTQFSLKVEPGHSLALVGQSGSGKSTVISLIERFYDVEGGQVSPCCACLHCISHVVFCHTRQACVELCVVAVVMSKGMLMVQLCCHSSSAEAC